jgi:hypothetical protein
MIEAKNIGRLGERERMKETSDAGIINTSNTELVWILSLVAWTLEK